MKFKIFKQMRHSNYSLELVTIEKEEISAFVLRKHETYSLRFTDGSQSITVNKKKKKTKSRKQTVWWQNLKSQVLHI